MSLVALSLAILTPTQTPTTVVRGGHSHNDYNRSRPLLDALDAGMVSVEADVFLVGGRLLVAHDLKDVKPDRNLREMYLKPLAKRLKKTGRVHAGYRDPFWVLVDIKTNGLACYSQFKTEIAEFPELMGKRSPVRFVISGDRPVEAIIADEGRYAGLDGRLPDLDRMVNGKPIDTWIMPWVSDAWLSHFKWLGKGDFGAENTEKLEALAKRVHDQGRMLRFWGTPDLPAIWSVQRSAGVDLFNAHNLSMLSKWTRSTGEVGVTSRQ